MRSGRGRVARRPASGRIRSQGRRRAPARRGPRRRPPALPDTATLAATLAAGVAEMLGPAAADAAQLAALAAYARLLERWSRAYNLVGPSALPEFVPRHLLDSLRLSPLLPAAGAVLDLGTGAGLPGLPLAALRPELTFTLLDRSRKKIRFVRQALLELELGNAEAAAGDAADHAGGPYDAVVARAAGGAAELLRLAGPLLAPGGTLLLPGAAMPAAAPAGWRAELRDAPAAPGGRAGPVLALRRAEP